MQQLFLAGLENDFAGLKHSSCHLVGRGHGRVEQRYCQVGGVPAELAAKLPDWPDWRSGGMVYSKRTVGNQAPSSEVRHSFINCLPPRVKSFVRAVRGPRGIENSVHWVLAGSLREDESRVRKDRAPENLALVRRLAAALLKQEKTTKGGIACKPKPAGTTTTWSKCWARSYGKFFRASSDAIALLAGRGPRRAVRGRVA